MSRLLLITSVVGFLFMALCIFDRTMLPFPLREYTPDFPNHPSRKFLFASEPYLEDIGNSGIASAHIDAARFAGELLVILALSGFALLATTPRA